MVYYSIVLVPSTHLVKTVGIDLLRAWYDVIDLEFIIYLMIFLFHFYLSLFHLLYFMSIPA